MNFDIHPTLPSEAGRNLGIGCIGAGFIMADCQLVAYQAAGLRVAGITSRDFEKAKRVAGERNVARAHRTVADLLSDPEVEVIDIAVPPDVQLEIVREVADAGRIRGILAQKPLGANLAEAREVVRICREAGITLAVNQNMRYDQSMRAARQLLDTGTLGQPVLATIDMRAIPHWMPWQERLGWVTLRIMSIHHLDSFRYLFGDPERIYASVRPDPRTSFPHDDGICLYILEYAGGLRASSCDDVWAGPSREGAAADLGIRWRIEGTQGTARGTIGWPDYPKRTPSTLDYTTTTGQSAGVWTKPRWNEVWFPDAFLGPMAELLCAMEQQREPTIGGEDNLKTMALVEAAYVSAREHRAIDPLAVLNGDARVS